MERIPYVLPYNLPPFDVVKCVNASCISIRLDTPADVRIALAWLEDLVMAPMFKSVELSTHVTLPYVEQGDSAGVPMLLLHGFLGSWRSFEPVLPHLPQTIHAFALTLRGHGDASKPATGYGVRDFAADLTAFLDALHLPAAVLVGHSMGSAVTLRFAIDQPDRTLGLVLVGASASVRGSPHARQLWDAALAKLTDPVDPNVVRAEIQNMLVQPEPHRFFETAVHDGVKVPAFVWRAGMNARWRAEGEFLGELANITAPTLIVWGDQDVRYPRSEQDALAAAIQHARLVVYESAGHLLHWEEPERFASDVVAFIEILAT